MKLQIILTSVLLIFVSSAFGHEEPKPKKIYEALEPTRIIPNHAEAIDHTRLDKLTLRDELSADILALNCKVGQFAICRGITVALFSSKGKLLAQGITDGNGRIGFEGLDTQSTFVARLESDKYKGEAQVKPGAVYQIVAEQK